MKNLTYTIAGTIILFAIGACQNNKANQKEIARQHHFDVEFIKSSLQSGALEIKASGLAITKSNNHRVIDFAKMMISEQTAINGDLAKLKNTLHVTLPDTTDILDKIFIDSLKNKSGPAFDKAYIQQIDSLHRQDSLDYAIEKLGNADIRKFVVKTLPLIVKHLDTTSAIKRSLK